MQLHHDDTYVSIMHLLMFSATGTTTDLPSILILQKEFISSGGPAAPLPSLFATQIISFRKMPFLFGFGGWLSRLFGLSSAPENEGSSKDRLESRLGDPGSILTEEDVENVLGKEKKPPLGDGLASPTSGSMSPEEWSNWPVAYMHPEEDDISQKEDEPADKGRSGDKVSSGSTMTSASTSGQISSGGRGITGSTASPSSPPTTSVTSKAPELAAAGASKSAASSSSVSPAQEVTGDDSSGPLVCVSSVKRFGVHHTDQMAERLLTDPEAGFWPESKLAALSEDPTFQEEAKLEDWFEIGCPYSGRPPAALSGGHSSYGESFARLTHNAVCDPMPLKSAGESAGGGAPPELPCNACYSWSDSGVDWGACKPKTPSDPPSCALVPLKELLWAQRQVVPAGVFSKHLPPRVAREHSTSIAKPNLGSLQYATGITSYFSTPSLGQQDDESEEGDKHAARASRKNAINVILHHDMPIPPPPASASNEARKHVAAASSASSSYVYPQLPVALPKHLWLQAYPNVAKRYDDLLTDAKNNVLNPLAKSKDYPAICSGALGAGEGGAEAHEKNLRRAFHRAQQLFQDCRRLQDTYTDIVLGPDKTEGTKIEFDKAVLGDDDSDPDAAAAGAAGAAANGGSSTSAGKTGSTVGGKGNSWLSPQEVTKILFGQDAKVPSCGGLTEPDFMHAKVNFLNLCKRVS
ncbi:unnamed protein product [Amoebophrya sp. A25]|nr:unnamed protein product [Amoebophrya sp. A25]|eukprot:GSA25T00012190001.1